jgi:proline dehydrogenase
MENESGPIELRIELPKGEELGEEQIKAALMKAANDPTFVQKVKDFFATSQTQSAVTTMVKQGS